MRSIVVYGSRSGNTRRVAEVIASVLQSRGAIDLLSVEEAPSAFPDDTDLIVVGGPTEGHGITPPVAAFFDRLTPQSLEGVSAAAFDTRLHWPRLLSGSAASGIAHRLHGLGANLIVPEESFLVTREPQLQTGELERAELWARLLVNAIDAKLPALAAGAH